MKRVEIMNELAKWQEENKDDRAVLIIASERKEALGYYESSQGLSGMNRHIIDMLKNALNNDKQLMHFLKAQRLS